MSSASATRVPWIRAKDTKVQLDTTTIELLIEKGYDPINSARPMRRAVEKYLEDPLAEELLQGNIKQGDTLDVRAAGERLSFRADQPAAIRRKARARSDPRLRVALGRGQMTAIISSRFIPAMA